MGTHGHGPILLVEDDADIRETVRDVLESEGYRVEEANNGFQAMARLGAEADPCVILLDLMMPGMSGEMVLAEMQKTERLKKIPVVVTTASPQRPEGASGYLRKPFGMDALLKTVRTYCDD